MFSVETDFPIAFDSPDHLMPWGAKRDNHSDTKFILQGIEYSKPKNQDGSKRAIKVADLGCSGGGLIKEWLDYTPMAIGLEGSDYSAKHQRAEWRTLYNNNLFTCDISRPFQINYNNEPYKADFISAWEVIEHIEPTRLGVLFDNVWNHLEDGGIFLGSGAHESDSPEGMELHLSLHTQIEWESEIFPLDKFNIIPYPLTSHVRSGCDFYFCIQKKEDPNRLVSLF
tara:strand:+ start:2026 stop:2703 length:678 start_codon:yes stop_codon:yes gene_type:complete